ncbi:MAG: hypothetical protein RI932_623, partial [Pseudomonadota bacterium]
QPTNNTAKDSAIIPNNDDFFLVFIKIKCLG